VGRKCRFESSSEGRLGDEWGALRGNQVACNITLRTGSQPANEAGKRRVEASHDMARRAVDS